MEHIASRFFYLFLLILSCFPFNAARAQCDSFDDSSCISISSLDWVGSGDFFIPLNWDYGQLFGGPNENNLGIFFGNRRFTVNGLPSGYDTGSSAEAVLASDYTTTRNLTMNNGIDTTLTIRNATYSLANAYIGQLFSPWPFDVDTYVFGAATVNLDNGNIEGNWTFYEDSQLNILSGNFSPSSGTINGTLPSLNISSGASYVLNGTFSFSNAIDNNGSINVVGSSTTGSSVLQYDGPTTLTGSGELILSDATYSTIRGRAFGVGNMLTNGPNHTIRGQGYISGDLVNQGLIRAEGGRLSIATTGFNNPSGQVEVAADAELLNSDITGTFGNLVVEEGGVLIGNSRFNDVNLSGVATLGIGTVDFAGIVNNSGRINLVGSSTTGNSILQYDGPTTLAGSGELILSDATYSTIRGRAFGVGNMLTNGSNHTIRGQGYISGDLVNQGLIRTQNGTLTLAGNLLGNGGIIEGTSTGILNTQGAMWTDVSIEGTLNLIGSLTIEDGLDNRGHINSTLSSLRITDEVLLTGEGSINFSNTNIRMGNNSSVGDRLVIGENQTIQGNPIFSVEVVNSGTLSPGNSPGSITFNSPLSLSSSSEIMMEVNGVANNEFDRIQTNAPMTLGGSLRLDIAPTLVASLSPNNSFVLIQSSSPLLGTFTNLLPGERVMGTNGTSFIVDYGPTSNDPTVLALTNYIPVSNHPNDSVVDISGTAQGGTITIVVNGVSITITTQAGETAAQIAANLAAAINEQFPGQAVTVDNLLILTGLTIEGFTTTDTGLGNQSLDFELLYIDPNSGISDEDIPLPLWSYVLLILLMEWVYRRKCA